MMRAFFFYLIAIGIVFDGGVFFFLYIQPEVPVSSPSTITVNQISAANVAIEATSSETPTASSTIVRTTVPEAAHATSTIVKKAGSKALTNPSAATTSEIERVQNPYPTPPESFDEINTNARKALVNILCEPDGASSLNPISGSGVIVDPRGIILTNAHVAQYVLLSESSQVNLQCFIRTGSPATAQWSAVVLYVPPIWVNEHASEVEEAHPTGTGEHDYALLYITSSTNGNPLPSQFPYLPIDTRPAIGFPGDQVLVASYPAELIGGIAAQYDLYADTSVTTVKQLLTFTTDSPDVLSLGGIIEAQSGSSGGAVVNQWGYLIALIATTSSGTTTADRDLRSVALSYINTDLQTQSGMSLNALLQGDPENEVQKFTSSIAQSLIQKYIDLLDAPVQ